ncbi:MAG: type II toxin-antitoxin system RelE/ParE family toxin [Planctomycetota bacterium]
MKVLWTRTALGHLTDIYEHIAGDSKRYAKRMVDRITARSKQIATLPESAPVVAEYGDPTVREVLEGPYRLIYRIQSDAVIVLAVIHGARLMPPEPPGESDA